MSILTSIKGLFKSRSTRFMEAQATLQSQFNRRVDGYQRAKSAGHLKEVWHDGRMFLTHDSKGEDCNCVDGNSHE